MFRHARRVHGILTGKVTKEEAIILFIGLFSTERRFRIGCLISLCVGVIVISCSFIWLINLLLSLHILR
jgi:hypothetical protein